jgi:sigma-E factor negative regulatory protein RseC
MEEIGIVISAQGFMAKVLVQKRGVCESCPATGTCKPSNEGMEIEALNPINARVGQTVKIVMKPQVYLKGTILVYGLPVIALIGGAILGKNIGEMYLKNVNSDIVAAIMGFAGLIITFIIIKIWGKKAETKEEYKPVIEEILE